MAGGLGRRAIGVVRTGLGATALATAIAAALSLAGTASAAVLCGGTSVSPIGPAGTTVNRGLTTTAADGAPVFASLYLPPGVSAATPAPAIMMTHGGGQARGVLERQDNPLTTTTDEGSGPHQAGILAGLLSRGYAVLAWDSRGHGESRTAGVQYRGSWPDGEVADVRALIDKLATCAEIVQDGGEDGPRVGMAGGSNGGLIQLAAAVDPYAARRLEAITPTITSADIDYEFFPNGLAIEWWNRVRSSVWGLGSWDGTGAYPTNAKVLVHPDITSQFGAVAASGLIAPGLSQLFAAQGPLRRASSIVTPTLVVQDVTDTGAQLDLAYELYREVKSAASPAPLRVVAACMGLHVSCPYRNQPNGSVQDASGNPARWQGEVLDWIDRWVRGVPMAPLPDFEWQDQDLVRHSTTGNPLSTTVIHAVGGTPFRGAGPGPAPVPIVWPEGGGGTGGDTAERAGPAPATQDGIASALVEHPVGATDCVPLVGTPRLRIVGEVTSASAAHAWVFAKLIELDEPLPADPGARVRVIDQMVTGTTLPIGRFDVSFDLPAIAWMLKPAHGVHLELTAGSGFFADPLPRPAYRIDLERIEVDLPSGPGRPAIPNGARDYRCAA